MDFHSERAVEDVGVGFEAYPRACLFAQGTSMKG